jgi:hypothetical protein
MIPTSPLPATEPRAPDMSSPSDHLSSARSLALGESVASMGVAFTAVYRVLLSALGLGPELRWVLGVRLSRLAGFGGASA